jgi:hypothetical protein
MPILSRVPYEGLTPTGGEIETDELPTAARIKKENRVAVYADIEAAGAKVFRPKKKRNEIREPVPADEQPKIQGRRQPKVKSSKVLVKGKETLRAIARSTHFAKRRRTKVQGTAYDQPEEPKHLGVYHSASKPPMV